uniref:Uncharacterized protein n=1 Tax=Arion vulgaris TaxID=1028688 RepID=A0A0B6ZG23_9EUPU
MVQSAAHGQIRWCRLWYLVVNVLNIEDGWLLNKKYNGEDNQRRVYTRKERTAKEKMGT